MFSLPEAGVISSTVRPDTGRNVVVIYAHDSFSIRHSTSNEKRQTTTLE